MGNLDAKRDWGHAKDYVYMQWLMLQQETPDDYVIATGQQYSVRQCIEMVGAHLDMKIQWEGSGIEEKGIDANSGKVIVEIDPRYFRPTEVETLLGDPTKAKQKLGWKPKISFEQMVGEMVQADLKNAEKDLHVRNGGFKVYNSFEL